MAIFLGNLKLKDIETRLGIELTDNERAELEQSRQEITKDIGANKWHGYDIPLFIMCGSRDMAVKVREIFTPYADRMKSQLQIGWDK